MSEAGSMKRQVGRSISGRDVRMRYANPNHGAVSPKSYGTDEYELQYIPTLIRLDYLNMELPPEQRAELRRQALVSCVGVEKVNQSQFPKQGGPAM